MAEVLHARRRPEVAGNPSLVTGQVPVAAVVDMGGTNTRVARFQDGRLVGEPVVFRTPSRYSEVRGLLRDATRAALGGRRPDAVGLGIAGEVSRNELTLDSAGELQEMGYVGQPIATDAAEAMGLREQSNLIMLNDCVVLAQSELTERRKELGLGSTDVLPDGKDGMAETLSTGNGAALYTSEGWLVPDAAGHRFYKSGALCGDGQDGHAEAWISGSGIARVYGDPPEDIPHDDPRWTAIKRDFHAVEDQRLAVYGAAGLRIGRISLTGSVAMKGPHMLEDLRTHLDDRAARGEGPKVEVVKSRHAEGGLVGAGEAALLTHAGNRPFVVYHAEGINAVRGLRASR